MHRRWQRSRWSSTPGQDALFKLTHYPRSGGIVYGFAPSEFEGFCERISAYVAVDGRLGNRHCCRIFSYKRPNDSLYGLSTHRQNQLACILAAILLGGLWPRFKRWH
jgi:hypothetical protein